MTKVFSRYYQYAFKFVLIDFHTNSSNFPFFLTLNLAHNQPCENLSVNPIEEAVKCQLFTTCRLPT